MAFDAHKNFAISTVVTAPSPATSGTTIVVTTGEGARFPAVPFNATVWPAGQIPTPGTAEVVRVTARTSDTLTITRAQESSTARSIVTGDLVAATITAKTITDLESGTNFPLITTTDLGLTASSAVIHQTTLASSDTGLIQIAGGGEGLPSRGAVIAAYGLNHVTAAGNIQLIAGNTTPGQIQFFTASTARRMTIHNSGAISVGSTTDPGVAACVTIPTGTLRVGAETSLSFSPKISLTFNAAATVGLGIGTTADSSGGSFAAFFNAAGTLQGKIGSPTSSTTSYETTSDARLKHDRGMATNTDVLRATRVHDFDWIASGTPDRGVFAQEAVDVLPAAVSVGTDDRTADGQLAHPWMTDYSKYVPDLIVGWQAHDAQVAALHDRLAALEARLEALTPPPSQKD